MKGSARSYLRVSLPIRNAPAAFAQIPRTRGGSLIGLPGGGLGFSGGVALGLKLALPERTIVQVVEIHYVDQATQRERVARSRQIWRTDDGGEHWWLTTGLPEF